ncbi:hypothetical protein [Streptomyces sp. bgisy031]|uniref:hypothetical protein n=1 Tax=Streptomyces sp. bgisy031 TaxID=3413772 RepID=UPI003D751AF9
MGAAVGGDGARLLADVRHNNWLASVQAANGSLPDDGIPDLWGALDDGHLWFFSSRVTKGNQPFKDLGDGWNTYQVIS